jgi:hypothetical protein
MAVQRKTDAPGDGGRAKQSPGRRDGQGEPIAAETGLDSGQWIIRPYLCITGRQFDLMRQGFWPVSRVGKLASGQRYIRIDIDDLARELGVTPEGLLTHNRSGTLIVTVSQPDRRNPEALDLTFGIDDRKTQCRVMRGPKLH